MGYSTSAFALEDPSPRDPQELHEAVSNGQQGQHGAAPDAAASPPIWKANSSSEENSSISKLF